MERPPLRLLLASFTPNVQWTGLGRWTHEIKNALEEQGHAVDAWFAEDFPRVAALGRLAVLAFPVALAARLLRYRHSYDAVIIHEPSGVWYGLLRRANDRLPPFFAMCHNVESHHFQQMLKYARLGLARVPPLTRARAPLLRHWQSDGAIKLADHVLCLSSVDAHYITGRLGVPPTRVAQFVNGSAARNFVTSSRVGSGAVLWVGGWLDVKGRRLLPRLWHLVHQQVPAATLIVVGTGARSASVLSEFDASDRDSITVLPRVGTASEMRALHAASHVYLLCSVSEGSPLSLLEAMAAGAAPVVTRVGGVPDLVTDGDDALLFDPEDIATGAALVIRLLLDPAEARRLGQAAQDRARCLTWDAAATVVAEAAYHLLHLNAR